MTSSAVLRLLVVSSAVTCIMGQTSQVSTAPSKVSPVQGQASQRPRPPAPQQEEVRCPVAQARTEITTPLPKPWWNTPQVGKLESMSIDVIAGKKTLVCHYWAYGTKVSVMRLFPDGVRDCGTSGDHFVCR